MEPLKETRNLLKFWFDCDDLPDTPVRKMMQNIRGLLLDSGLALSIKKERPVDAEGDPIPWFTFPSIEYLNQLDFSHASVLEFGSGYSTVYWAKRARIIESIERDPEWFSEVNSMASGFDNVTVRLIEQPDYAEYLGSVGAGSFDVIIVDGRDRLETVQSVWKSVSDSGIVILDNSDWYPNSAKTLRDKGFAQFDFIGFGPINNYRWCTSIFLKHRLRFGHRDRISVPGGRDHVKDDDLTEVDDGLR